MYYSKPGLLIEFHGCEESVRDEIVSGKKSMLPSSNDHDWLGKGYYFWENNFDRALDFAINPPGKKEFKSPAVLGAVLDLQNCLDLMDTKYLRLVQNSFDNLDHFAKLYKVGLPVNKPGSKSTDLLIRELDCAVIENLHKTQEKLNIRQFDSARGLFVEGNSLYPGAGFHEKSHVQICIRNPNCIKGFFVPRSEVLWP